MMGWGDEGFRVWVDASRGGRMMSKEFVNGPFSQAQSLIHILFQVVVLAIFVLIALWLLAKVKNEWKR